MASSSIQALRKGQKTKSTPAGVPAAKKRKAPSSKESRRSKAAHAALQAFTTSTLYKLPPELRNRIYSYAPATDDGWVDVTEENGIPEPALLFTCKHIRKEAIGIFYNENKFLLIIKDCHPAAQILWNRKRDALAPNIDISTKQYVVQEKGLKHWNNLKKSLQAAHGQDIELQDQGEFSVELSTNEGQEVEFRFGLEKMASMMMYQPWEEVEKVVDSLCIGLIKIHPGWARDYTDSD